MKNAVRVLGTIVFMAIIAATLIACGPPRLTGTVSIEGDPMVGKTLTANIGFLGGNGIITYQWLRDGATAVADTNAYTLQPADRDSAITVTVIRSDNSGSVTSTPVTPWGYSIGEIGPGGGVVFYVDPDGFTMSDTGKTAHFLEAALESMGRLNWASPAFIPTFRWGGAGNWRSIEGTSTAIGTGRQNTAMILAVDANAPAALACRNYSNNGFNDWFLPSRDELTQLYRNRAAVNNAGGNLGTSVFWSSSQFNLESAWGRTFSYNWGTDTPKDSELTVRPIRAF